MDKTNSENEKIEPSSQVELSPVENAKKRKREDLESSNLLRDEYLQPKKRSIDVILVSDSDSDSVDEDYVPNPSPESDGELFLTVEGAESDDEAEESEEDKVVEEADDSDKSSSEELDSESDGEFDKTVLDSGDAIEIETDSDGFDDDF